MCLKIYCKKGKNMIITPVIKMTYNKKAQTKNIPNFGHADVAIEGEEFFIRRKKKIDSSAFRYCKNNKNSGINTEFEQAKKLKEIFKQLKKVPDFRSAIKKASKNVLVEIHNDFIYVKKGEYNLYKEYPVSMLGTKKEIIALAYELVDFIQHVNIEAPKIGKIKKTIPEIGIWR